MNNSFKKRIKTNGGQAMLVSVIFFLSISLAIIVGLVLPSVREFRIASDLSSSRQSFFLSESGVEDAYYRLKTVKPIGTSTSITLNGNIASTSIADSGYNEKTIISLGDVSLRQRQSELKLSTGTGVSFSYGIQAGTGGFTMNNNAGVNGNVYSNGNITGANGAFVSGATISAGSTGIINDLDVGANGIGDAQAHTVMNSTVAGNLYCQIGSGNNKACNTSQSDPVSQNMPITQATIDQWKSDAALGGTISGSYTFSSAGSFGPKKITGNLTINADMIVTGTIYVVGKINTSNGVKVSLSPSYGGSGGIIVTDGYVDLLNNVTFLGSGSANSYIMLITTSNCPSDSSCNGQYAFDISNNVGAIIVNAQDGTVHLNNNVTLNEVVGKTILMDNNAVVNYLSGLANASFSSGPTGGWSVKSWKEVE